jgi:AraC-like DNA-binding protein
MLHDYSAPLFETIGLRAWAGKFQEMPAAHRHNELELNYIIRGSITYLIGGSLVTVPARRLCVLWGAIPHQAMQKTQSIEAIWVTVPLKRALAWKLPRFLMRRLLRYGLAIEAREQSTDETLMHQWILDLKSSDSTLHRAMPLEVEARICRMANHLHRAPSSKRIGARQPSDIPEAVEQLAQFVVTNYQKPIAIAAAARAAHIHPHYAMTLFRRHTGMTLNQYLTLQRISHAQRLLITTRQPILDIVFASGFNSISRFYEAFRQQTGRSPRQIRLQAHPSA